MVITGKKINLYKLASKDVSLEIMVQSVVLAVEAVSNGVLELRNFKKGKLIIESIIKINEISEVSINNFYQCLDSLFEFPISNFQTYFEKHLYGYAVTFMN